MLKFMNALDIIGDSLTEGFATTYFGRRGAAMLFTFLKSLFPMNSLGNGLWIAAYVLLNPPEELTQPQVQYIAAAAFVIGLLGVVIDVFRWARRIEASSSAP